MVRWLVLGMALFVGLAAAQDLVHEDLRDTRCWECHSDDPNVPAPLRAFWQAVPDAEPITGPTPFQVTLQNSWYHDITRLVPTLDLTDAPSLAFVDERVPVNATFIGTVTRQAPTVTPATPPEIVPIIDTPPARGNLTTLIPEGATRLHLAFEEIDPDHAPEVQWRIHTGAPAPVELTSQGGNASIRLASPDAFLLHGFGTWVVEAIVPLTDSTGGPNVFQDALPIRARLEASFDPTARLGILSSDRVVGPGEGALFAWQLQRLAAPGPGEVVRLHVDGTVHHAHLVTSNAVDEAHVRTTLELPVQEGGGATLLQSDIVIVEVPSGGGSLVIPVSEVLGYMATASLVTSLATGGIFGRTSRRWLNRVFGSARQRVAFHNVLSYGIIAFSMAHLVLFLILAFQGGPYSWTLGLIWGGLAILAMLGLGLTGALQVPILRRWNYPVWRWTHFGLAIVAVLATAAHLLLDGAHFGAVQEAVGWQNPLDRR